MAEPVSGDSYDTGNSQDALNAIYQELLGRDVDASGAETFRYSSDQAIREAIYNSPEYYDKVYREENQDLLAQIAADEQAFQEEQARLDAEISQEQVRLDSEFEAARAEIEAMNKRETEVLAQQRAQFEQAQAAAQAAAAAQQAEFARQQALVQEQIAQAQREQEAAAARFRTERDTTQREGAEREVASRRAGRTAVARSLLAGVQGITAPAAPTLGMSGALADGGGQLGAATALGG